MYLNRNTIGLWDKAILCCAALCVIFSQCYSMFTMPVHRTYIPGTSPSGCDKGKLLPFHPHPPYFQMSLGSCEVVPDQAN